MANKYYAADAQRAARVGDLFAAIAPRYDLVNDLQSFGLHRLWKRRVARLARGQPGECALDLCCGTGDLAFALAAHGVNVVGLDFSEPMLAVARDRARVQGSKFDAVSHEPPPPHPFPFPIGGGEGRGEGERRFMAGAQIRREQEACHEAAGATFPSSAFRLPHFLQGDALHIPFPDAQFDIVTIGYGLRNLASFEGGLREMWRVARPGGRLLVLDFGVPDNALWRGVYFAYLRWFVPVLGRLVCGDAAAYAYILESLKKYPAQKGVAAMMRDLGCRDTVIHNLLGGMMSINCGVKPGGENNRQAAPLAVSFERVRRSP